ncbi:siroheme synthase [Alphaproteobacteria bacterium]|nr:siroheme synthase [Alphaproteobacteria bacterium]
MLPVVLDVSVLKLCVVGSGPQAQRRLQMLDEARAQFVRVYCNEAVAEMDDIAGDRIVHRLPTREEIADCHVMYVANLSDMDGERLTAEGREVKTLVNVEDVRPLCDFHVPAMVRRGDLLLGVSTGGKSPGLARKLKEELEKAFPEEWAGRLQKLSDQRDQWKSQGLGFSELIERTKVFIEKERWFS